MNKKTVLIKFFCWICLFLFTSVQVFSQGKGTLNDFGKSRVQYKDFDWFYYRSTNFDTYYYRSGKELAISVGKMAEQNLIDLQEKLDYKLDGRIKILAYNKQTDVRQTNLGLNNEFVNIGGVTQIIGSKIYVYFNGDYIDLERQIKAGIATVLINQLLYGGNLQEMLQSSALLTLPDWFVPGLVSYLSNNWDPYLDNDLKDGILSGRFSKFSRLNEKNNQVAGHSIWKYIFDTYGAATLSNILYMTRINRNAESGFLYVLSLNFQELTDEWRNYYKKVYADADKGKTLPNVNNALLHKNKKKHKNLIFDQATLSPDGRYISYSSNEGGAFKVWLFNIQTKKTTLLFKGGIKSLTQKNEPGKPGYEPVLTWHPSSQLVAIAYEVKSNATIYVANIAKKKEKLIIPMYKYEKILDFSYSDNGRKFVLSAIKNGQSDIFVFDIPSRRDEQITNDYFDDHYPRFIKKSEEIIFSSNRTTDSLQKTDFVKQPLINSKDLFIYHYAERDNKLVRVTNTPFANEIKAFEFDSSRLVYLSDESGIFNRFLATRDSLEDFRLDTTIGYFDTTFVFYKDTFFHKTISNYSRNILSQDINKRNKQFSEVLFYNNKYQIFKGNLTSQTDTSYSLSPSTFKTKQNRLLKALSDKLVLDQKKVEKQMAVIKEKPLDSISTKVDSTKIDINNYTFQSEFPVKKEIIKTTEQSNNGIVFRRESLAQDTVKTEQQKLEELFKKSKARPYLPVFSTNYVVTQLDNSVMNTTYEFFTGSGPIQTTNRINALIKVGASDLMEDYKFTGGFRLAGNLTIPEYYASFENLKKRIDKQFIFYKRGEVYSSPQVGIINGNNYEFRSVIKYPFSEVLCLRFNVFYRRDELIPTISDQQSIRFLPFVNNNLGLRVELVGDNTVNKGINLYNGSRYKIFVERFQNLDKNSDPLANFGFDARHYEKISRQIILALRAAGESSISKRKVAYYLGGVDNDLFPSFYDNIEIKNIEDYQYQALATNLRGFDQNIRNGNSYFVLNAELRVPIFAYLFNRPIKSDFVKNFQIVGFADAGTAWVGLNPLSEENSFNRFVTSSGPITVTVIEEKSPIVGGTGLGIRSRLLGYFVRFDYAWGIQNGGFSAPLTYLSLNLDF